MTALRQALDTALPQGSWEFENGVEPERWIVCMGKYPDNDTLNKKLAELRSLNIRFEPLSNPLSPGFRWRPIRPRRRRKMASPSLPAAACERARWWCRAAPNCAASGCGCRRPTPVSSNAWT
ncbi:MAG: hypothetical protein IPO11_12280, partial [Betaproteobacteria bacterium]|nr:hypothetical protein [Betaproteobacteria bacterium]